MRRLWVVGAVIWLVIAPSLATAVDPAGMIRSLASQALEVLSTSAPRDIERRAKLETLFRQSMDIDFVARFAAGRYWRQMSDQEQQDYRDAFEQYVLRLYAGQLNGYSGESFTVLGSREVDANDTIVSSQLSRPNKAPVDIDWRVRMSGGEAKIIDVSIEGVSMALNQRQEFSSIMQREGVAGLIKRLRQPG
tara:strand:+ start:2558 stop:3133 length:576 start_codon:yes stop_codon:yes gene_type:complete